MADYPTMDQLRDPNFVMPMNLAAPQDRGESAPAANPAPGPGNETEPRTDLKEFVDTESTRFDFLKDDDAYDNDATSSVQSAAVSEPKPVKEPASKGGGVEVQGAGGKGK